MNSKSFFTGRNITIIAIVIVALILFLSFIGSYNSLVQLRETTNERLSTIDILLQRRSELIPNLVSTVQGYAKHETEAIEAVTDARTKYGSASTTEEIAEADTQMSSAISRLLVIAENYPDLKADANFRQLADELAGTENRISVSRQDYNTAAREYNTKISTFPSNIFAGMFGFEKVSYFEVPEGSKTVPKVEF